MIHKKIICLNMIVKNESAVIRDCLLSVKPWIDHWVIVDTGSNDGTQEIIRDTLADIPGELYERPWVHFEHNRNEALQYAKKYKTDYLLIIDADECLSWEKGKSFPSLYSDAYFIKVKLSKGEFLRLFLIQSSIEWVWEGVIHETLCSKEKKGYQVLEGGSLLAISREGARGKDPETFAKDIAILEKEHQKKPHHTRTVFYLAQTYLSMGEYEKALFYYQKRARMGEWDEEVFWALFQVAVLKEKLQHDASSVIEAYNLAYQNRPTRAEPLFYLALYYIKRKQPEKAYSIAQQGIGIPLPADFVYVDRAIYEYGFPLLLADAAFKMRKYQEAAAIYQKILARFMLEDKLRQIVQISLRESIKQGQLLYGPIGSGALYTKMNSKVGNLAKPAPQIWSSEAALKQLNLTKLGDASGSKDADVRHSQNPTFEFISVYSTLPALSSLKPKKDSLQYRRAL